MTSQDPDGCHSSQIPKFDGTTVTFTANPVNEGPGPVYQWKVNGNNVGTNSPGFASGSFVNGDVVSVTMTANATCAVANNVTSNSITIVIADPVTPAVSIITSSVVICAGRTVNLLPTQRMAVFHQYFNGR